MNIVIVDDDINLRKSLEISLSEYKEFKIKSYKNAKDALKNIDDSCDLIITDINMPDMNGIDFLKKLDSKFEAIIITGYASINIAIEALRLGVKDFFIKTELDIDLLVEAIKRSQKEKIIKSKISTKKQPSKIVLEGKNLVFIKNLALKSAKSDANVLLLGESGVGKEVFAKFIHDNSERKDYPFIAINMAALPENLLESELFGYEKGAFTDASNSKMGLFEVAHKGSVFLDEIGEMPLNLQAKLLRVLQEREITRLGGVKSIKIDVRFISATNANIEDKVYNHNFREDLFYRLQTIPIRIPPLRERKDEIINIAESHLKNTAKTYKCGNKILSKEAKEYLLSYKWPGNIRELLSIIERATILSEGEIISKDDLFLEPRIEKKPKKLDELEKEYIKEAYLENHRDIEQTANMLGMSIDLVKYKLIKFKII
ncbi:sigma-54 dependent transcriptional regulator [Helicobacter sp. MIT 14-3879]|uniref:sigma-54-dependent transcriptional regulator n=1 Tax=Helicobacter sp. MIT 14-3879 TaxID=2040649 RepID=UPI000E1E3A83|nr:sigma-54 dependent transcriptional regulator [Helicobacter sp. MIT 14-3879]RDU62453.1 sigma-54-dependent Fis family transcriptional regulator [Helicobacter sp. MIT 14-3879]